jgi:hypothetical protein
MALASASPFPSICLAALSLLDSAFALFLLTTISTSQYVHSNCSSSYFPPPAANLRGGQGGGRWRPRGGEGGSRRVAPRWSSTHGDPFLPSGLPWPPPVTFVHPQPTHEAGRSAVVSGPGAPKARGGLLSDASALSPSSDIRGACHMSIVRLHLSCCHRNPSLCPAVYGLRQAAGPSP